MTRDEIQRFYQTYLTHETPFGGMQLAASEVLDELSLPPSVDTLMRICTKQWEALIVLVDARLHGNRSTWGSQLEKLFIYDQFFVDCLRIQEPELVEGQYDDSYR